MNDKNVIAAQQQRWLVLFHQLPAKPAYLRVKVWRRLQALGAVAVKNAVYVLPASDAAQEDFAWLQREIVAAGGEAAVCEARFIVGLTDLETQAMFDEARDADYAALAEEARALALAMNGKQLDTAEARTQLTRLVTRRDQIAALDFFGANGRETVDGLLAQLRGAVNEEGGMDPEESPATTLAGAKGRVWVTRRGVHVDRMACAWLIRRFIDPDAHFKFVPPRGYTPSEGELRFDMFEAEFTHEGDRCSFEVLIERAGLAKDPALAAIARIVHDIDIKDGKFGSEEVAGIRTLVTAICMATQDDEERIARGTAMFEDLYAFFAKRRR
jgi:hypothetical protein